MTIPPVRTWRATFPALFKDDRVQGSCVVLVLAPTRTLAVLNLRAEGYYGECCIAPSRRYRLRGATTCFLTPSMERECRKRYYPGKALVITPENDGFYVVGPAGGEAC